MQSRTTLALSVCLLTLCGGFVFGADKDSLVGTWKLNLDKSKNDPPPNGPAPQSVMRTFEDRGGGVFVATTEATMADGKKNLVVVTFKRDGKPYAIATNGGGQNITMMAFKKVDANHNEHTTTINGKIVNTGTETISPDRKVYTEERKGTNAGGKPFHNIGVWERQ